jgi:hypothetical protein
MAEARAIEELGQIRGREGRPVSISHGLNRAFVCLCELYGSRLCIGCGCLYLVYRPRLVAILGERECCAPAQFRVSHVCSAITADAADAQLSRHRAGRQVEMPHYYFDLIDGVARRDRNGLDCTDDADALVKAAKIANEVAAAEGDNFRPDLHISIVHEDGREVSRVAVPTIKVAPAFINPNFK